MAWSSWRSLDKFTCVSKPFEKTLDVLILEASSTRIIWWHFCAPSNGNIPKWPISCTFFKCLSGLSDWTVHAMDHKGHFLESLLTLDFQIYWNACKAIKPLLTHHHKHFTNKFCWTNDAIYVNFPRHLEWFRWCIATKDRTSHELEYRFGLL